MRTASRLVIRGRSRASSSAPQRCVADAAQGRAREPYRMVRDDGQAAAHAVAVAPDTVRRRPPIGITRVAVHLRLLRGHVDVVRARPPRVAAGLPDALPQHDPEVGAHGHEGAIEDEVADGDGSDGEERPHGDRRRHRPRTDARAREQPARDRERGSEQEEVGAQPHRQSQHRPCAQRAADGQAASTRHGHEKDEGEEDRHRAHHVRRQESGVVREVRKERGQEAGSDRGTAAEKGVREQEDEHGHQRVQRVLHELGREKPAAHEAIDGGEEDRVSRRAGEETSVGGIDAGDEEEPVAAEDGGGAFVVALHHARARLLLRFQRGRQVHGVERAHGQRDQEDRRHPGGAMAATARAEEARDAKNGRR